MILRVLVKEGFYCMYNIMARSVQEITSFVRLVSIIIIIHNVINNKVFLYTAFD